MKFFGLLGVCLAQQATFLSPVHRSTSLADFENCRDCGRCVASKVKIVQERSDEPLLAGLSYADMLQFLGTGPVSNTMEMVKVNMVPLACIDDRVPTASVATPGGDLGEFILGLDTYIDSLPQDDAESLASVTRRLTDNTVRTFLQKYLESIPPNRAFIHCTDDRAIRHLEQQLDTENL